MHEYQHGRAGRESDFAATSTRGKPLAARHPMNLRHGLAAAALMISLYGMHGGTARSAVPGDEHERPPSAMAARLGRNLNGYQGESIDIHAVLNEMREVASANGWRSESLSAAPGLELLALQRQRPQTRHRIYISTGIHGDEPAGPLAIREMLIENNWPEDAEILLCPCLNPTGFLGSTRTSAQGIDLNRDYRDPQSPEIRAHVRWFERQPRFDLSFCLHEDWEAHGFYVYELNPESSPSLAEAMVRAVRAICPIDHSTVIDGRDAREGIIRPHLDPASRPDWPEALYLISRKTPQSYTLEAPSDFPLPVRVKALVVAMRTALSVLPRS